MKLYEVTATCYVLAHSTDEAERVIRHERIDWAEDDVVAFVSRDVPSHWRNSLPYVDGGYDADSEERTCGEFLAEQRAVEAKQRVEQAALSRQLGVVLPQVTE